MCCTFDIMMQKWVWRWSFSLMRAYDICSSTYIRYIFWVFFCSSIVHIFVFYDILMASTCGFIGPLGDLFDAMVVNVRPFDH